jgi:hypothetical protein
MIRLIFATVIALAPSAALAQQPPPGGPNPRKLMACKQLALQRGYTFGVHNKGAIKPKDFVRGCMQGRQR